MTFRLLVLLLGAVGAPVLIAYGRRHPDLGGEARMMRQLVRGRTRT
ncbi:hypothetical protein [Streptomyces sp. enrichment culture]